MLKSDEIPNKKSDIKGIYQTLDNLMNQFKGYKFK